MFDCVCRAGLHGVVEETGWLSLLDLDHRRHAAVTAVSAYALPRIYIRDRASQNIRMKRIITTLVLCLLLAPQTWAGIKEAGMAYKRGDYATALRELRPLAEQGNPGAQLLLATMYEDGRGVSRDYVQAYKWYSLTASNGDQTFIIFRIRIAEQMTPAQIAEAQKLASEWYAAFQRRKGK